MRYAIFHEGSTGVKFYGPFAFNDRCVAQQVINVLNANYPTMTHWLVESDARKLKCFNCLEFSYLKDGLCIPCMSALERGKAKQ